MIKKLLIRIAQMVFITLLIMTIIYTILILAQVVNFKYFKNNIKTITLQTEITFLIVIVFHIIFPIIKRIRLITCPLRRIDKMTGVEFEEYVFRKLKSRFMKVSTTSVTGDYGVDLIIHCNRRKGVIQLKRYKGSVGVDAVQQIYAGKTFYDADIAMVVTNSYFTNNAIKLADTNEVKLLDRDDLPFLYKEIKRIMKQS